MNFTARVRSVVSWLMAREARRSTDSRLWHLLVNVLAGSGLMPLASRLGIYAACGLEVRTGWVLPGCYFFSSDISIGANTWINHRCYFDTRAPIEIGDGCDIAMEVMFCTSTHDYGPPTKRAGKATTAPIRIEDGCWIGTRAVILPGVTVGRGCIIAGGAVVRENCASNGLYAGVPARRIRDLATE